MDPGKAVPGVVLLGLAARVLYIVGLAAAIPVVFAELILSMILLNMVIVGAADKEAYPWVSLQLGVFVETVVAAGYTRGFLPYSELGIVYSALLLPVVTGYYSPGSSGLGLVSETRAAAAYVVAAGATGYLCAAMGLRGFDLFYIALSPIAELVLYSSMTGTDKRVRLAVAAAAAALLPAPAPLFMALSLIGMLYKSIVSDITRALPIDYAVRLLVVIGGTLAA